jgi:hypothetical protein
MRKLTAQQVIAAREALQDAMEVFAEQEAEAEAFVQELVDFYNAPQVGLGPNVVQACLTIHGENDVSYCPPSYLRPLEGGANPVLTGESSIRQYFSDRMKPGEYQIAPGVGEYTGEPHQPFDEDQTDQVLLNIYQNPVSVELVLQSWGNQSQRFDGFICFNPFLYSLQEGFLIALNFQMTEERHPL